MHSRKFSKDRMHMMEAAGNGDANFMPDFETCRRAHDCKKSLSQKVLRDHLSSIHTKECIYFVEYTQISTAMAEQPYSVSPPSSVPNRTSANRCSYQRSGNASQHWFINHIKFITTYRIHGLQYGIAVDIHVHGSPTLDASVHVAISSVGKA